MIPSTGASLPIASWIAASLATRVHARSRCSEGTKGRIIGESPKAGTRLTRDSKINLTVSAGKDKRA
jgi:beta-lactam-binding protein with PASTA domain